MDKVNAWRAASSDGAGTRRVRLHSETDQSSDETLHPPPARKKSRFSVTERAQELQRSSLALSDSPNNNNNHENTRMGFNTTAATSAPISQTSINHHLNNNNNGMSPPRPETQPQSQSTSPAHRDESARQYSGPPSPWWAALREQAQGPEAADQLVNRGIDYTQMSPFDSVRRRPLALISRRYIDSASLGSIGPSPIRSSLLFPIFEDIVDENNGNGHNDSGMDVDRQVNQLERAQGQNPTIITTPRRSTGTDNSSAEPVNNPIQSRLMAEYSQTFSEENKENTGGEFYIPNYWAHSEDEEHAASDAEMATASQHPNSPVDGNAITDAMPDMARLREMAERASVAMEGIQQEREDDEDEMEIDRSTTAAAVGPMAASRITGGASVVHPGLAQATAEPAFPSLDGPPRRFPFGSAQSMALAQSRGSIVNTPGRSFHGRRLDRML